MSLAFSIFEVGVGTILGYVSATEQPKNHNAVRALCWIVISGLVAIESVLYFQVGLTIADIYVEDAMLMIADGESFRLILQGAWFAFIGPVIVLSLYLLGHKVSESYFKYSRYAVLDDFRESLETAYELSQKYLQDIKSGDQQIEEIKLKLKKLDINRQDRTDKLPDQLAKYSDELNKKLKLCEEASEKLKSSQIQAPAQRSIPVGSDQGADLLKSGVVYFAVLALSVLLGMWALPIEEISFIPTNIAAQLAVSLFMCMLCIIGGYSLSTRISVAYQDSESSAAFLTSERSPQTTAILAITLLLAGVFYALIFKDAEAAYPRALLVILINIACIYVGTRLTSYLPVWIAVVRASLWTLSSGCLRASQALIFLGTLIFESMQSLIALLAKPAQTLFERKRNNAL